MNITGFKSQKCMRPSAELKDKGVTDKESEQLTVQTHFL